MEHPLEEVRAALEVDQALDVMRIVDARMSRVLADELVGLVDRRFRLVILVIGVEQVELALLGLLAERDNLPRAPRDADRVVEL